MRRSGPTSARGNERGTAFALLAVAPLARAPVLSWPARTPPTLVGTRLYLRDWREAVALELGV